MGVGLGKRHRKVLSIPLTILPKQKELRQNDSNHAFPLR